MKQHLLSFSFTLFKRNRKHVNDIIIGTLQLFKVLYQIFYYAGAELDTFKKVGPKKVFVTQDIPNLVSQTIYLQLLKWKILKHLTR